MSDLVERLRGILAKATSGPFTADRDLPVGRMPRVHCGDASLLCEVGNMGTSQDQWEANAALIAGGLTTLPELFDRIEQLEAREKKMREALIEIEMLEIDWTVSTAANMRTASDLARAALSSCDIEQIVAAMERMKVG